MGGRLSMSERKKPSIGFLATVVVVTVMAVPVLYLLILGPVAFLTFSDRIEFETYRVISHPVTLWGYHFGFRPEWFWLIWGQYMDFWSEMAGIT